MPTMCFLDAILKKYHQLTTMHFTAYLNQTFSTKDFFKKSWGKDFTSFFPFKSLFWGYSQNRGSEKEHFFAKHVLLILCFVWSISWGDDCKHIFGKYQVKTSWGKNFTLPQFFSPHFCVEKPGFDILQVSKTNCGKILAGQALTNDYLSVFSWTYFVRKILGQRLQRTIFGKSLAKELWGKHWLCAGKFFL